ncbi:MAG: LacI family DNA-binding transcriptional regulator [Nitriliruptoraceae bacterium]
MDHARQRPSRPTLADVAERAGVSSKSVSRVVNGEAHVRPELAARIRAAIDELGYRPDHRARDLASGPAVRSVGYVQVDAANPFFAAVYRGLEDVLGAQGILLVAGSTDASPARERELLQALIDFRVGGLIVAAAEGSDELLAREITYGTPLVCVDRVMAEPACDTVVSSNRASMRRAVEHLLSRRHERIAFMGGRPEVWTASERLEGYREAVAAAGVPAWEITGVDQVEAADHATRGLLDTPSPPTALVTGQDRITTGAIAALHAMGREHEVALFGFDELPFTEQLQPSISVVAQDPRYMGARAAQLLLSQIAEPGRAPELVVVEAPLIHRASGDIPPAD